MKLTSSLRIALRAPARARATATAPAQRFAVRGMAGSSVHNEDPSRIAREKARNLSGEQDSSAPHKEHAPGWNEHLASESEANVKADQAAPSKPTAALQEQTIKQTHEHHGEAGEKGAAAHSAQHKPPREPTDSEASVRAEQGEKTHH